MSEEGCIEDENHEFLAATDPAFLDYWQYHSTPCPVRSAVPAQFLSYSIAPRHSVEHPDVTQLTWAPSTAHTSSYTWTPQTSQRTPFLHSSPFTPANPPTHPPQHRHAIALDCEMGTSTTSEVELIRLTAIDFFTSATLIDNLVQPSVPMAHYNTRYSGVSAAAMRTAVQNGTAIRGRDRARTALLQFVGPETVVVVHGGKGDFGALRWIHTLIVDTYLLEGYVGVGRNEKGEGGGGRKSLKDLCKRKVGVAVQMKGKLGHDSYEDAMASRELVVQWMKGIPDT